MYLSKFYMGEKGKNEFILNSAGMVNNMKKKKKVDWSTVNLHSDVKIIEYL